MSRTTDDGSNEDPIEAVKREILAKTAEFYRLQHADRSFKPDRSFVQYGGRVFDERELINGVEAVLEFQLTNGRFEREFAERLIERLDVRHAILVNSGSSANLIALSTLCSQQLPDRLLPGDEVITPAATFPTTLAPIVQNQLVPVLVDCELGTYNIDVEQLEAAYSDRVRAICVPHTLGNPVEMDRVLAFAQRHSLYVIEDTCDALGSRYDGQWCGTLGHIGTLSFYPAHHITTGEGGAVITSDDRLAAIAQSFRDWGRADPATVTLPDDELFDRRYYYTEIGYNLKMTELQAAIGAAQIEKLATFVKQRRANFDRMYAHLSQYADVLQLPTWRPKSEPAWFAFPITVRPKASFNRAQLTHFLNAQQIETRYLFAGSILEQPGYRHIQRRVVGDLRNADTVLRHTFFVGVYPGLDDARIEYVLKMFDRFFNS